MDADITVPLLFQIVSQEIYIQKLSYVYAFLHIALQTYSSASTWNAAKPKLYAFLESPIHIAIQLPFLDISTRTSAKREKRDSSVRFRVLTQEQPHQSERILSAMIWTMQNGPF
jgi:hypothetical protein